MASGLCLMPTARDVSSQEELADYLAEKRVELVASLPSYEEDQTDKQRGLPFAIHRSLFANVPCQATHRPRAESMQLSSDWLEGLGF